MNERKDERPVETARTLFQQGQAARHEGRDEFAHGFFAESLERFRAAGDRTGTADALVQLADLALHYNPTGEESFGRRKALCEEALAIYRDLGDTRGTARALRLLASIAPKEQALGFLEESLDLARAADDKQAIAASLERLGAHHAFDDPAKSLALKEEALSIFREIGDRSGEAVVSFGLAIAHLRDGPARSREYAAQALRLYRELGARKGVAFMLRFLAQDEPDDETRIAYLTECREISRELGEPMREAGSLRDLAVVAEKRGDTERAQALRTEADAICPELPEDRKAKKAFERALKTRDRDAAMDAAKRMFGERKHGK